MSYRNPADKNRLIFDDLVYIFNFTEGPIVKRLTETI